MAAYYNEFDPKTAAWLRELIKQGHIADGVVDERSIEDVRPADLKDFTQCHFFAGIGVWSYALRRAGWADDRPIWTGSCPCQPFSAAGKGAGFDDDRHLWPAFHHLISQCRPDVVLGEQVASKDGLAWLDLVQADLEATGYATGAVDLCAAGVGAPHIRQRLWWVGSRLDALGNAAHGGHVRGDVGNQAGPQPAALSGELVQQSNQRGGGHDAADDGAPDGLADANGAGQQAERPSTIGDGQQLEAVIRGADGGLADIARPSATNGHWRDADWLFCRGGKWRPVEPSTSPLAHGSSARVGRLRGYGNAIVAQAAQAFVEAVMGVV